MKLYAEFQRFNVFRKPDWRFERVLKMCDREPTPGRCTKRDDKYIREARKFLLRWRGLPEQAEREELFWENRGLYYAYEIFEKSEDEPEPALMIEARLLAREDFESVAKTIGTLPETIEWYEALFFNVCDRLEQRDWITKQVLLPAIIHNNGYTPKQLENDDLPAVPFRDSTVARPFMDASLKLFSYFGGKYVVDIMITGFQSGKLVSGPDQLGDWFDKQWSMTIRKRSHQAAAQFEINKYNVMELFAVHTRIIELEKSADTADQERTITERHIKSMIDDIPWAVGDDAKKVLKDSPLRLYDEAAAELRDDEVLRAATGEVINTDDFPKRLPPPTRAKPTLLTKPKDKGD